MWLPFQRRRLERRNAEYRAGYTDGQITAMERAANGETAADVHATSAAEYAVGLWARALPWPLLQYQP